MGGPATAGAISSASGATGSFGIAGIGGTLALCGTPPNDGGKKKTLVAGTKVCEDFRIVSGTKARDDVHAGPGNCLARGICLKKELLRTI